MQITIKGEMKLAELKQALFESLGELETDFAIAYSKGATLYVNPTNGEGDPVVARGKDGKVVGKVVSDGPYRSVADTLKL